MPICAVGTNLGTNSLLWHSDHYFTSGPSASGPGGISIISAANDTSNFFTERSDLTQLAAQLCGHAAQCVDHFLFAHGLDLLPDQRVGRGQSGDDYNYQSSPAFHHQLGIPLVVRTTSQA